MITTKRYFIHIDNGSVVPWTSEIESNYKFKEITAKVAMAIEHGKISAKEVIVQITKQIKPGTLEQMLDAKLKMNVREGDLNLEKQVQEDNSQKDGGEADPYDIKLPGNGKPTGGKKNEPSKPETKDKKSEAAEADGDSPADKVANALDGDEADDESVGGVNV